MGRACSAPPATLFWLILLCVVKLAWSQSLGDHQQRQLHDVRKLQAGFWLKVASKQSSSSSTGSSPDGSCLRAYGQQYLDRWRALQGSYCNATVPDAGAEASSSHVQCYAHPEADLSTCMVENLLLQSTTAFMGSSPHTSELPQPAPGSIQLACNTSTAPAAFLRGRLQSNEGSRAWLVTAARFGPASTPLVQRSCTAAHAVAHPVLFLLRVDPQNAFHNLETVVSVFSALAVLQLQPGQLRHGLEVVIADDRQAGYFMPIWRRLSWPHQLRVLRQQPFPDNTCFSTAIIAPYTAHAQSLLTYKAGSVDEVLCESVVLQATSRWLRHMFRDLLPPPHRPGAASRRAGPGLGNGPVGQRTDGVSTANNLGSSSAGEDASSTAGFVGWRMQQRSTAAVPFWDLAPLAPSPAQSEVPLELLYVIWLSRQRFERQHDLTSWQKARALSEQQQEELVVGLQRAVLQWNARTCVAAGQKDCQPRSVMFSLQVVELSELSFYPDQLALMMRTGVLAGVHGAGLANQVYMLPRTGAVVEVWYGMDSNTHYHNMAHMLGHAYFNIKCDEGQLDVAQVVAQVLAGMNEAAARHAAVNAAKAKGRRSWWWSRMHATRGI